MENKTIEQENADTKNEAIFNLIQNIQSKLNNEDKISQDNSNECITSNVENKNNNDNSSNLDIGSIINMFGNFNNSDSGFNLKDIDPSIFNKIQKIVVSLGKKDPKKDLLQSLKPFLRKSRQDKIGEYITILTAIKAFEAFKEKGSDKDE